MEIIIVVLLVILIIKDYIPTKRGQKRHNIDKTKEVIEEKDKDKIEALQKEFDNIMTYSIQDAINEKKRGE